MYRAKRSGTGMIELAPEQILALAFCRRRLREPYGLLLRFDRSLGRAMPHLGPPIVGQVRLAWWREQIRSSPGSGAPDPVLDGLGGMIGTHPAARAGLAALVDGWEALVADPELSGDRLLEFAKARGGSLFRVACIISGGEAGEPADRAGTLWALVDFARHCSDRDLAAHALALAGAFGGAPRELPRALRPFAILAHFADRDVAGGLERMPRPGSPRRIAQAWKFSFGLA